MNLESERQGKILLLNKEKRVKGADIVSETSAQSFPRCWAASDLTMAQRIVILQCETADKIIKHMPAPKNV